MNYKIKQGVSAPDHKDSKFAGLTDALRALPVGDYYIDLPSDAGPNVRSIAQAAKIRIATEIQKDLNVLRVWRREESE